MPVGERLLRGALPASLAVALSLGTARADISVTGFSFAANGDVVTITPFDPMLGTLDSVNVTVNGTFIVLTQPSPNIGLFGPIPYSFTIEASQSFAAPFVSRGYNTVIPANFVQPDIVTPGNGGAQPVDIPFADSFTFTATTDLAGETATTAGGLISGQRSGFLPSSLPIEEIVIESSQFVSGLLPVGILDVSAAGAAIITYDYTPAAAVPAPRIGRGLPVLLAVVGLLFGVKLREHRRSPGAAVPKIFSRDR